MKYNSEGYAGLCNWKQEFLQLSQRQGCLKIYILRKKLDIFCTLWPWGRKVILGVDFIFYLYLFLYMYVFVYLFVLYTYICISLNYLDCARAGYSRCRLRPSCPHPSSATATADMQTFLFPSLSCVTCIFELHICAFELRVFRLAAMYQFNLFACSLNCMHPSDR